MATHKTENIRNLALVGQSGSGKSTLIEALLAKTGAIKEMGSHQRGGLVTDFDPLEKLHQHSLDSSIVGFEYDGVHCNFIDTPGYPDFRGPTLAAMAAVETTAIVINAQSGIELSTRRLMKRAVDRKLCRMIIINKIDADTVDLTTLVRQIREEFGNECLPINLPAENHSKVRDCFFHTEGETDIFSLSAAHDEINDQVAEVDDDLMDVYLEQGKLSREQLHEAFEIALRQGHLVPICFVSAQSGAGIDELLKFCKRLAPNPFEGNPPPFLKGQGEDAISVTALPEADAHVIAHVFKITNDPFVGKLSVFRVYQGTIEKDSQLFIGNSRKAFKVGHLFRIQGSKHVHINRAVPGDICAVAKIEDIHYDAVLHDSHDEDNFHLKPLDFPHPMFGLAVTTKVRGQEQKLATSLHHLSEEDPCLSIEHNQELNETIVHGLGDMHLKIMLERMQQRYKVDVDTRPPRIAYRETITIATEGHYRHKKQTGGAGQFGEVYLRIRPLMRGQGFAFVNKVVGASIPTNLIPAVEKGVRLLLVEGAVAGHPLQDIEVTVYDGKHHPVDSKEIAFVTAGKKAFLAAILKANAQILEPVVNLEVSAPDSYMGDITGSLASKRARISGTETLPGGQIAVSAQVPLSVLTDYQTELKSITGGEGSYTMTFSHYDPVPGDVQSKLVAAHNRRDDD